MGTVQKAKEVPKDVLKKVVKTSRQTGRFNHLVESLGTLQNGFYHTINRLQAMTVDFTNITRQSQAITVLC